MPCLFSTRSMRLVRGLSVALAAVLAGCASLPALHDDDDSLQREAVAATTLPPPPPRPVSNPAPLADARVQPQITPGSGDFYRVVMRGRSSPGVTDGGPGVTFNFENQPVQGVVKAILGDMLKQNYTIAPGVQGSVTFSTSRPVDAGQALPILETLLSWTGNALVRQGGSYVVMPAKDAVAGNLVPGLGAVAPAGGLQARLFPLHYISALQMEKLIKPFARSDAVLLADPSRNLLVLAGTPDELANYQATIRTFDVDWLRGMSIGVFSLQHANVGELMPQLDQLFGPNGNTPLAGMFRFMPIQRTNALVVITTQPQYLDEVGGWINKIDSGGGNEPQLYVYDVRNMKASDLAKDLAEIYASGGSGGAGADRQGSVGAGLTSNTLGGGSDCGNAGGFGQSASSGLGGAGGRLGNSLSNGLSNGMNGSTATSTTGLGATGGLAGTGAAASFGNGNGCSHDAEYASSDGSVRIGSVDVNNQLLVRVRPSQWNEIEGAIRRLDVVPLQVQIETKILEVDLTGQFAFGVQWYLQGLAGSTPTLSNGVVTGATSAYPGAHRQISLGSGGNQYGGEPFFYSFLSSNGKFQVALRALETSGNTKILSAPSLVVLNNQVASIQVGDEIPVNQTSIVTGLSTSTDTATTASSVSYLPTGVILNVQPRVNPGGLVYLNIDQQVSATQGSANAQGNYTVQKREIGTQVAVQSGQTVLLGGLIQQQDDTNDTGIPGLNRIPILGRLFGSTNRDRNRTELLVLITPKVIGSSAEAREVTQEYQQQFESLAPLHATPAVGH